ncbi:MAG: hypothetical protein D6754_13540 [Alphaproteobacteria bacterium]|nr:MAG: hypothetical protein D6754_13540 [Alphaproteobacteria bacterium]
MGRLWRWPGWHWLHSFFGMGVWLFLFFLFLTGTLSVFGHEIDWLTHPQMRADPGEAHEKLPWGRIYDAARAALPAEVEIVELHRAASPLFADSVQIRRPGGAESLLWVDPYAPRVQGETSFWSFHGMISQLHKRLMLPGRWGTLIVTLFTLPLIAAIIAGLMLYRRFWTGFFRRPRLSGRTRAWASDLHRLSALWLLPFLVAICLTGLWYLLEVLGLDAGYPPEHLIDPPRAERLPEGFDGARIDAAIAIAQDRLPGLAVTDVVLPRWPQLPIVVWGNLTATLVTPWSNTVHLDPGTLEVLGTHRGEELSVHMRISEMADPIHFGFWGGTASRILWAVFGVMLCALAVLGLVIHIRRVAAMEAKRGRNRSDLARAWRDMGPWGLGAWGSAALIAAGLAMMVLRLMR